jgi:hypothetical protein
MIARIHELVDRLVESGDRLSYVVTRQALLKSVHTLCEQLYTSRGFAWSRVRWSLLPHDILQSMDPFLGIQDRMALKVTCTAWWRCRFRFAQPSMCLSLANVRQNVVRVATAYAREDEKTTHVAVAMRGESSIRVWKNEQELSSIVCEKPAEFLCSHNSVLIAGFTDRGSSHVRFLDLKKKKLRKVCLPFPCADISLFEDAVVCRVQGTANWIDLVWDDGPMTIQGATETARVLAFPSTDMVYGHFSSSRDFSFVVKTRRLVVRAREHSRFGDAVSYQHYLSTSHFYDLVPIDNNLWQVRVRKAETLKYEGAFVLRAAAILSITGCEARKKEPESIGVLLKNAETNECEMHVFLVR